MLSRLIRESAPREDMLSRLAKKANRGRRGAFAPQLGKSAAAAALGIPGDIGGAISALPAPLRAALPRTVGGLGSLGGIMKLQGLLREKLGMEPDPLQDVLGEKSERIAQVLPTAADLPGTLEIEEAFGGEGPPLAKRIGRGLGAGAAFGAVGGPAAALRGAARFGAAGLAGQAVEDMSGSKVAGILTELTAGVAPDVIRGILSGKVASRDLAKLQKRAEEIGLSKEQTSALLHSSKTKKILSKFIKRGPKSEKLGIGSRKIVGEAYDALKASDVAKRVMGGAATDELMSEVARSMAKVNANIQVPASTKKAMDYLQRSINSLAENGATGEELINWYQTLGQEINWNTVKQSDQLLSSIRSPIKKALTEISPQLGEDFALTNDLYSRSTQLAKLLKPTTFSAIADLGEYGELIRGVLTLSPKDLLVAGGTMATRRAAGAALTSKRLLDVQKKIIRALNEGKLEQALNLSRKIAESIDPPEVDIEEFRFGEE